MMLDIQTLSQLSEYSQKQARSPIAPVSPVSRGLPENAATKGVASGNISDNFHAELSKAENNQPVLKMKKHDRMGGSVPVWETQNTAKDKIEFQIADAMSGKSDQFDYGHGIAGHPAERLAAHEKPFSFGDIVDMVNPLQHIPLVGSLYREITGDDMRGSSRIIGGAVFGGALGAASGLANTISENETGKDISQNAMSAFRGADDNDQNTENNEDTGAMKRNEQILASAAQATEPSADLAAQLNALDVGAGQQGQPQDDIFSRDGFREITSASQPSASLAAQLNAINVGGSANSHTASEMNNGKYKITENVAASKNGRMAGSMVNEYEAVLNPNDPREKIRTVNVSTMPTPLFQEYFNLND